MAVSTGWFAPLQFSRDDSPITTMSDIAAVTPQVVDGMLGWLAANALLTR